MPYTDYNKQRANAARWYFANKRRILTRDRLRQLLIYNKITGVWNWRAKTGRHKSGTRVGTVVFLSRKNPYLIISIGGRFYLAHRLAWFYVTKKWPQKHIDHKNRNGLDNRWKNLREATRSQNLANSKIRSNNRSGYKGVCAAHAGKWRSSITVRRKVFALGVFATAQQAHRAYARAAKKHFGVFARVA